MKSIASDMAILPGTLTINAGASSALAFAQDIISRQESKEGFGEYRPLPLVFKEEDENPAPEAKAPVYNIDLTLNIPREQKTGGAAQEKKEEKPPVSETVRTVERLERERIRLERLCMLLQTQAGMQMRSTAKRPSPIEKAAKAVRESTPTPVKLRTYLGAISHEGGTIAFADVLRRNQEAGLTAAERAPEAMRAFAKDMVRELPEKQMTRSLPAAHEKSPTRQTALDNTINPKKQRENQSIKTHTGHEADFTQAEVQDAHSKSYDEPAQLVYIDEAKTDAQGEGVPHGAESEQQRTENASGTRTDRAEKDAQPGKTGTVQGGHTAHDTVGHKSAKRENEIKTGYAEGSENAETVFSHADKDSGSDAQSDEPKPATLIYTSEEQKETKSVQVPANRLAQEKAAVKKATNNTPQQEHEGRQSRKRHEAEKAKRAEAVDTDRVPITSAKTDIRVSAGTASKTAAKAIAQDAMQSPLSSFASHMRMQDIANGGAANTFTPVVRTALSKDAPGYGTEVQTPAGTLEPSGIMREAPVRYTYARPPMTARIASRGTASAPRLEGPGVNRSPDAPARRSYTLGRTQNTIQSMQSAVQTQFMSTPREITNAQTQAERTLFAMELQNESRDAEETARTPAAGSEKYTESEYVKSLPDWARSFLKESFKEDNGMNAQQRARLEQLALTNAGSDGSTAASAGNAAAQEADGAHMTEDAWSGGYPPYRAGKAQGAADTTAWQAEGYAPPEAVKRSKEKAQLAYKEKKQNSQAGDVLLRVSDAEINRVANRIYGMIEERMKRDRRRNGQ